MGSDCNPDEIEHWCMLIMYQNTDLFTLLGLSFPEVCLCVDWGADYRIRVTQLLITTILLPSFPNT